MAESRSMQKLKLGGGGRGSGRQSRLSGTLHTIRRVCTQSNQTLDGLPGIQQNNFIWPSCEFCSPPWHRSEKGHLLYSASLTQQHSANDKREGRKESNTLGRSVLGSGNGTYIKTLLCEECRTNTFFFTFKHMWINHNMHLFLLDFRITLWLFC